MIIFWVINDFRLSLSFFLSFFKLKNKTTSQTQTTEANQLLRLRQARYVTWWSWWKMDFYSSRLREREGKNVNKRFFSTWSSWALCRRSIGPGPTRSVQAKSHRAHGPRKSTWLDMVSWPSTWMSTWGSSAGNVWRLRCLIEKEES